MPGLGSPDTESFQRGLGSGTRLADVGIERAGIQHLSCSPGIGQSLYAGNYGFWGPLLGRMLIGFWCHVLLGLHSARWPRVIFFPPPFFDPPLSPPPLAAFILSPSPPPPPGQGSSHGLVLPVIYVGANRIDWTSQ